ncbi:MAG: anthranilate phosphoribosyltransferase [Myxococcota bacterium]
MTSEVQAAIADLVEGRVLEPDRLARALDEIMEGRSSDARTAAFLVALRLRGETVPQLIAAAKALRARAVTATPRAARIVDTCGTGGSGLDTFNISTTAAFVVAGAGVPVAKHGNRAASSRSGSFDLLEALGIAIDLPIGTCAAILDEVGIGAFFARTAHPAFRHVAAVRAELGVRTFLNWLGPLLSPVGARYQVVGVSSAAWVEPLAAVLVGLGAERALVVHGDDGLDELTTAAENDAALVSGGRVERLRIDARSLGLPRASLDDLRGGTPAENAATTRAILAGERGPRRDIVLLNAAAALFVVEAVGSLAEGIGRAEASIDSGAAAARLTSLRQASLAAREREREAEAAPAATGGGRRAVGA